MFETRSEKDTFAHDQKIFLSFIVKDSYTFKNLFENKDLDEAKTRFWRKKIKRSTAFLSKISTQILTFPGAKCFG
jgi:hypothetical protein